MLESNPVTNINKTTYNHFLLLVAGLGGLLYGVDVGIISGALPYLEATSRLNSGQLSFIVAAVLLGSVISTLFAGALADFFGRKKTARRRHRVLVAIRRAQVENDAVQFIGRLCGEKFLSKIGRQMRDAQPQHIIIQQRCRQVRRSFRRARARDDLRGK